MESPKTVASHLPRPFFSSSPSAGWFCFRKKLTVIGIIGKTHGVSSATKPHAMASRTRPQMDLPSPGAGSFAPSAAAGSAAETTGRPSPAGRVTSSVQSSGGMQFWSLQACHSMVTGTVTALPCSSSTFCAMTTGLPHVPISMPKTSSKPLCTSDTRYGSPTSRTRSPASIVKIVPLGPLTP